jgi:class 3 adenylate cyclase
MACLGQDNSNGSLVLMRSNEEGRLDDMLSFQNKSNFTPSIFWDQKIVIEALPGTIWFIKGISIKKLTLPDQNAFVTDLTIDKNEALNILLSNGTIYKVEKGSISISETLKAASNGPFQCFLKEENGNFWIGGYGHLQYFNAQEGITIELHDNLKQIVRNTCQVREIFKDKLGVIWAATDFGLVKITRPENRFDSFLSGGNEYCNNGFCSMRGLAEGNDGSIYAAYYNGIHVYQPKAKTLRPLFPNRSINLPPYGLHFFKNKLYTGNGLCIDPAKKTLDTLLQPARGGEGVLTTFGDQLLLGLEDTLYQLAPNGSRWLVRFVLPGRNSDEENEKITTLLADDQSLLIGTYQSGIFRYHPKEKQLESLTAALEPELRVICLEKDAENQIWAGTSKGLMCFDASGNNAVTINRASGLENEFINGLLFEGDSAIWISTDMGLARIVPNFSNLDQFNTRAIKIRTYQLNEGLSANEFNRISFLKSKTDTYYFGGLNGVNFFKPSPLFWEEKQKIFANLVCTGFSKLDGSNDSLVYLQPDKIAENGVKLLPSDKFFQFDFSLLNYKSPETNQYAFYLDGYEKDWSAATNNTFIRYDNIPPGRYVFRLKASPDGIHWNTRELSIPVFIARPFYQKAWFLIVSIVGLLVSIWLFIRWRVYNLNQRRKKLEKEVKIRTEELEHEKQKSEKLLLNILPEQTAEELKSKGKALAKRYEMATVLFTDFRDFSEIAGKMEPEALVDHIDYCFRAFDDIIEKYHLEKIKTIGDAYMCAAGLDDASPRIAATNMIKAAIEIRDFIQADIERQKKNGEPIFEIRIGVHTGPVVAGVVGSKKFAYDIWGDTVNIASRMETYGRPGQINISQMTYELVKDQFPFKSHEVFMTKNDIPIQMYAL